MARIGVLMLRRIIHKGAFLRLRLAMEGGHFYVFEGGGLYYPYLCYIFSPVVMNLFDNLDHAMQLVEDLLRDYMISIFD